ncbi:MAG: hybrid sensor histidine kinase/response regulator [Anaerolineales bacterium]|nr:hybrid sensor histidine kinase/response regulator [Anaerolineales bacterium]
MADTGRILVIDDELGIREGCKRALSPQGYHVELAATMREGLHKAQQDQFDLVLLDVMMPDGRGVDLLEPIHAKDPDIVCVIITGYATVELAVQAIRQGAYDFISKPFTADVLLTTVEQGLERRRLSLEARRLGQIERRAADLAREKEEIERLDRLKTQFMWTVAHELRSPVGGALSLLRPLRRGLAGELNQSQNDILERIEIRLEMLRELINDLLDLAAGKAIEAEHALERLELRPVLQKLVDYYLVEAKSKGIEFSFDAPRDTLEVRASQDGLEKIFRNLISNAIKYTPQGGHVRLVAESLPGRACISVTDTGMGIPADALPHLWEEFFRATNARHSGVAGTGLGLSIVKQYVEGFGGQIEAHSEEGKGSTFTVTLPLEN